MSPASRVSGVNPGPSTSSTSSVKKRLVVGDPGHRRWRTEDDHRTATLRGEAVREHPDVLNRHVGMDDQPVALFASC